MIGIERDERARAWMVIIGGWALAAATAYAVAQVVGTLWARLGVTLGGGQ